MLMTHDNRVTVAVGAVRVRQASEPDVGDPIGLSSTVQIGGPLSGSGAVRMRLIAKCLMTAMFLAP